MIADANYGLPLAHVVTTASRHDSREMSTVFAKTESLYPWFHPSAVIADRGYDSAANHDFLRGKDALPIIHIRRNPKGALFEGIYTEKGVPTCLGQIPMEFVRSDPERGHLYRCNPEGCRLAGSMRGGIRHCDTEVWEDPARNIRLFGAIRRDGPEWKALYAKRQGHREGVQVDEGVETAGAALCPGATADHPSRHDVGTGLSSHGAGEAEDGAGRYDAVDGQESSLADHLEVSRFTKTLAQLLPDPGNIVLHDGKVIRDLIDLGVEPLKGYAVVLEDREVCIALLL